MESASDATTPLTLEGGHRLARRGVGQGGRGFSQLPLERGEHGIPHGEIEEGLMPWEYSALKDAPLPGWLLGHGDYDMNCPKCGACPFVPFLRGTVQSTWRRWFGLPYCCVICERCKEVVGYEKPALSSELETLAAELHWVYQREAKRQGDVRHQDNYEDLPENIKDFDRALAKFILDREHDRDKLMR